jgi:hypothetical protein
MKPFTDMNDQELKGHIVRLKRDVHDFSGRATHVAAAVRFEGRDVLSDPLYQRYSSIREYLGKQLLDAEREDQRRREARASERSLSLGAALSGLCFPWRRARVTK